MWLEFLRPRFNFIGSIIFLLQLLLLILLIILIVSFDSTDTVANVIVSFTKALLPEHGFSYRRLAMLKKRFFFHLEEGLLIYLVDISK